MSRLSGRSLPWLLGVWLLLATALADGAETQPIPPLRARVTDLTGTLAAGQQAKLDARLAAFERAKGAQIAVLIVATVQPETIEQYALRVVEAWQLGRQGIDDGALLLVARDDRKLRIEVGYGLEGVLNDATAKRIVSETISPRFRQGDFAGGIDAGVDALLKVVGGEPLPPPAAAPSQRADGGDSPFETLLMVGFMIVFVIGRMLRAIFGSLLAAIIVAVAAGVLAALLLSSLLAAVIIGVLAFFASLLIGALGSGVRTAGGGPWRSGGGGGRSGGFSGGGGRFGGGGASGGW